VRLKKATSRIWYSGCGSALEDFGHTRGGKEPFSVRSDYFIHVSDKSKSMTAADQENRVRMTEVIVS
jgi:hypothetical protein